jgi:hypothetical protein
MSSNTRLKQSSNYLKAPQPHYTKVLQACQVLFLVNFNQADNDPSAQSAGAERQGKFGRFFRLGKGPLEFPKGILIALRPW